MNSLLTTVLALSAASCSNDDAIQTETTHSEKHVAYVATLSTEQQKLLQSTGNPFGNAQQKDAWTTTIASTIPTRWGLFDDPRISVSTRAIGIYGFYPARYWTMLRVKFLKLPGKIKDGSILAIAEMEEQTNVLIILPKLCRFGYCRII